MIKSFIGSMTTRIFLILVGGTILSGALVMTLTAYERRDLEAHMRMRHTAERVEQIIQMLDSVPVSSRGAIAGVAEKYGIRIDLSDSTALMGKFPDTEFSAMLRQTLGESKAITVLDRESQDCPVRKTENEAAPVKLHLCQAILTTLKDGTPLRLDVAHRDHSSIPYRGNFVRDLLLFLSGIILIALLVAYMATKPLRKLAQAAYGLGRNIERQPLPENKGAGEVREASMAFNIMQAGIRNYIQGRTCMLAAISHDLQTPLTRLRLHMGKGNDEDLHAHLVADLTATLAMVREELELAQSINAEDPFELVDLDTLIETICNDATDAGWEVTCEGNVGKPILASPQALRRCIFNLLDNAIKYGKFAHLSVKRENSKVVVSIIDGGSGIPDDQLEAVFQPLKSNANSKSSTSAGTGLGLTIARIIAEKHGGSIKLKNIGVADLGLVATLELPA